MPKTVVVTCRNEMNRRMRNSRTRDAVDSGKGRGNFQQKIFFINEAFLFVFRIRFRGCFFHRIERFEGIVPECQ